MDIHRIFNRARIDDRLANELIGLSRGIIADGAVSQQEAEFLQKWLTANATVTNNPVIQNLLQRIGAMLSDGVLDADESAELLDTLSRFTGGHFELGEITKSNTLPLDHPAPNIEFVNRSFCFTGTFAFGTRADCIAAIEGLGATTNNLTKKTDYLVIGVYATDSWAHSSYGRKIEKAVEMRQAGVPIAIVGEEHWLSQLQQ